MFTDPLTRVGGEKCSYHLPTYEAIKGICKSIYWKPTFIWYVDQVRLMRRIRTQTKGMKPLDYNAAGNTLAIYTYLTGDSRRSGEQGLDEGSNGPGVEYQVRAHFEWNPLQPALAGDRNDGKHFAIARRSLERGGRQDIFLGTRECQGYVEPCAFGSAAGDYDSDGELQYGLMFHSFDYPDETGKRRLATNFWRPKLIDGVLLFPRPDDTSQILKKDIRAMNPKRFGEAGLLPVDLEFAQLEDATGPFEREPGASR
jgi:CRISPR-associated protein Cas5d